MSITISDENKELMAQRYNNGEGLLVLERDFRINKTTVRRILIEKGVTIRGKADKMVW